MYVYICIYVYVYVYVYICIYTVYKTFGIAYQMEFVTKTQIFGAIVWLIVPNTFVSFSKIHS